MDLTKHPIHLGFLRKMRLETLKNMMVFPSMEAKPILFHLVSKTNKIENLETDQIRIAEKGFLTFGDQKDFYANCIHEVFSKNLG